MLVPDQSKKVRKISFPSWYLKVLIFGGFLLTLVSGFIFFDYIHLLSQVAENKKLRHENIVLKNEIVKVQTEVESLGQSVGRLKSFAHKIQALVNLDTPGGSKGVEAAPHQTEDKFEADTLIDDESAQLNPSQKSPPPPASEEEPSIAESTMATVYDLSNRIESMSSQDKLSEILLSTGVILDIVKGEERKFARLQEGAQDAAQKLRYTPSLLPAIGWISSRFGTRIHPVSKKKAFHNGIDIANMPGTKIRAPADAVVGFSGYNGHLGKSIRLDHGYNVVTRYGHMSKLFVKKGQQVKRGETIGTIGNTGRSTGPHLHYQVELRGRPVNPKYFILEKF
jgi:murein DD-endopeptidase MepM/ murein hydrolase activator NlpD